MFHKSNKVPKGNIIVFALSTIAVMSLSAAALSVATLLELRKESNVSKAVFAEFNAESAAEQMLYVINASLKSGKDFVAIQEIIEGMFGLPSGSFTFDGTKQLDCDDANTASALTNQLPCESLFIALGVNDLPLNLSQNESFTLNLFDVADRNKPPYPNQLDYKVDRITIDWSGGGAHEFELSFFAWNKDAIENNKNVANSPQEVLLFPVKRRVSGNGSITFSFKNGSTGADDICTPLLSKEQTQPICDIGQTQGSPILLGTIIVKQISSGSLNGATLRLWDEDAGGLGVHEQRQLPGFIEIRAVAAQQTNKKAVRILQNITASQATPGKEFLSEIWDYAIFSEKSISK